MHYAEPLCAHVSSSSGKIVLGGDQSRREPDKFSWQYEYHLLQYVMEVSKDLKGDFCKFMVWHVRT